MDSKLSRRAALTAMLGGSAAACAPRQAEMLTSKPSTGIEGNFKHGVASGDPLQDSVIIWTRLSRARSDSNDDFAGAPDVALNWELSENEDFKTLSKSGEAIAYSTKDWTVKIDVTGLKPGTWYYYRFKTQNSVSPIGKTRTLPKGKTDQARFAIVSCANYQQGFFNVYNHISRNKDFDALIHLGDYIYEYGSKDARPEMKAAGRVHKPANETFTLQDYRARHAQYREDQNLQAVTAIMPMIAIWDDHETANDSSKNEAENHQDNEGSWEVRKERAMRAYYEWMPVRDPLPGKTREHFYRSFEWGDLITLAAIETRLLSRSPSFEFVTYFDEVMAEGGFERIKKEKMLAPDREMMGPDQVAWLADVFGKSKSAGKKWRLLLNQVLFGRMVAPDLTPYMNVNEVAPDQPYRDTVIKNIQMSPLGLPLYPDCWDGYPAARERFYSAMKDAGVEDMLVVTGDAHEFWVNDLTTDSGEKMGAELCTSSVSSETRGDVLGDNAAQLAMLITQGNSDVRYYNPLNKGYIDLTLDQKKATAKMVAISTAFETEFSAFRAAEFTVRQDGDSLKVTSPKGLTPTQRALFEDIF